MKILITWAGPWEDKGEAAMLISTVKLLKEKFPHSYIVASMKSSPGESDVVNYGKYGIKIIPGLFHSFFLKLSNNCFLRSKIIKSFVAPVLFTIEVLKYQVWLLLYKFKFIKPADKHNETCADEYEDADCVIMCGGGNIYNNGLYLTSSLLVSMYEILFCTQLRKPMMIWANSIGPFKLKIINPLIARILNKVKVITTREEISKSILESIGVSTSVFLTADAAFSLEESGEAEARKVLNSAIKIPPQTLTIGVTAINKDFYPENQDIEWTVNNYFNTFAGAIDLAVSKYGVYVIFFPHNRTVNKNRNDKHASMEIRERLKNKSNVYILDGDYPPEQMKGMYGCMDLFIGTRFHSCIFALSMCVPTIVIGYSHKAPGIVKMLDMQDFLLDINHLRTKDIIEKIDRVFENDEVIKNRLRSKINIIQSQSRKNLELAEKYLNLR
jgi:colanic acid/amylovoran biosynthesis protein